jgi:hypothetical protein
MKRIISCAQRFQEKYGQLSIKDDDPNKKEKEKSEQQYIEQFRAILDQIQVLDIPPIQAGEEYLDALFNSVNEALKECNAELLSVLAVDAQNAQLHRLINIYGQEFYTKLRAFHASKYLDVVLKKELFLIGLHVLNAAKRYRAPKIGPRDNPKRAQFAQKHMAQFIECFKKLYGTFVNFGKL